MEFKIGGDTPIPPITDLKYITSNVGVGSYTAFFIDKVEKVENNMISNVGIGSYIGDCQHSCRFSQIC